MTSDLVFLSQGGQIAAHILGHNPAVLPLDRGSSCHLGRFHRPGRVLLPVLRSYVVRCDFNSHISAQRKSPKSATVIVLESSEIIPLLGYTLTVQRKKTLRVHVYRRHALLRHCRGHGTVLRLGPYNNVTL